MNAGIAAHDSSIEAYNLLKAKKKDYVIFAINPAKTHVVVESTFPESQADLDAFASDEKERKRETNFNERVFKKFKSTLVASKGPRFAVIDFRYIADERPQDKVVFFFWCPDSTGVRDKMMAASTYQSFSAKLGVAAKVQVQDASDVEIDAIITKLTKA